MHRLNRQNADCVWHAHFVWWQPRCTVATALPSAAHPLTPSTLHFISPPPPTFHRHSYSFHPPRPLLALLSQGKELTLVFSRGLCVHVCASLSLSLSLSLSVCARTTHACTACAATGCTLKEIGIESAVGIESAHWDSTPIESAHWDSTLLSRHIGTQHLLVDVNSTQHLTTSRC